ncbi:MAG TPA: SusD/RagB family nutrient-binding outer membrane lipoprotein [Cyclobacteriaceae bacterium]|nr:SusD/RagB family nutrient-binding outer membrane lipoprotein [Cyclobacteriaceae bacterium]
MKYFRKIIAITMIGTVIVTGCNTDDLKDLNVNPQALETIDLNFLFTSAQLGAASAGSSGDNRYIDWRTNIGMCSFAIQQLANAGGGIAPGDKYEDNFETAEAPFQFFYLDQLKNIAEILRQTGDGGYDAGNKTNMRNAARILRVFLFHRATDYYGSVPYFEAVNSSENVFFPKYDKQKDIYADLLKELEEATAALGAEDPADGFAEADLYFDGDTDKWKKWGYSLMLRLALRISNVDAAAANTYVTKAVAGGVFQSNLDNVWVPMAETPSLWTNQNGISRAFYPGDGGQPTFLSKTFIDWLKGANQGSTADDDPRLMIISGGIAEWTPTEWIPINVDPLAQKGMPNGMNQSMLDAYEGHTVDQDAEYSKINYLFLQRDEPYMLMNYGEVELMLAEALERGIGTGITGTAQSHYEAGVRASMQMLIGYDPSFLVTDAKVDAYLATYPYGGPKPELEMIGEQLWVNHFLNWWEAWSDWRRTGFPQLTPTNFPGNVTGGTIPVRLKYPNSEVATNPNFESGATLPNLYTTKVWWAGGPE